MEFSHKISQVKDEKITHYFTPEWNNFITEKVTNWINLFNRRLCYEDKTNSFFFDKNEETIESNTNDNKETEEKNENENENENENNVNFLFYNIFILIE